MGGGNTMGEGVVLLESPMRRCMTVTCYGTALYDDKRVQCCASGRLLCSCFACMYLLELCVVWMFGTFNSALEL